MSEMGIGELSQAVSVCLDELIKLKEENAGLRKDLEFLSENNKALINAVNFLKVQLHRGIDNVRYEIRDENRIPDLYYPSFYPLETTIRKLKEGAGMARFGDGEFALMAGRCRQQFQETDEKLSARLRELIRVRDEGFLIGIADNYGDLSLYNDDGRWGIRMYMTDENRKEQESFLEKDKVYHNAYISRPYALFADNGTDAPKKRFEALQSIWADKKLLLIEGNLTRMGVGNDLFDNAGSVRRIECPPKNAFEKYDSILNLVKQYVGEDDMILIALGPTAGVLAYDLYREGLQAIDIGHLDLEYEWYLKGTGGRCEIKNKYNNEMNGGDQVSDLHDPKYESEIVARV